jgi:hypothetical protein
VAWAGSAECHGLIEKRCGDESDQPGGDVDALSEIDAHFGWEDSTNRAKPTVEEEPVTGSW